MTQLVEDGFLDPKRWHESAVDYANDNKPPTTRHYTAFDHKKWSEAGLEDFGDFVELIEFINQSEYGDGQLEGEWYYCNDDTMTIYNGEHGNDNSPGASMHTHADVYSLRSEYEAKSLELEMCEEYLDAETDEEVIE